MWFMRQRREDERRNRREEQDRISEQIKALDRQHVWTSRFTTNWERFEAAYTLEAVLKGEQITPLRNARIERDSLKAALAVTVLPEHIGHLYATAYSEARAEMDAHLVCWEKRIAELENEIRKQQENANA